MSSVEEPYVDIPWFWSDQHGQNLQVAGLPDQATQTIFRDTSGGYTAVHLDGNDAVVAVAALNNARDIRAGTNLIKSSRPVDRALLERVDLPLQQIAKAIC
jgi:3-phenylpropionate/trans-cinnamate dioxygenase ferredoxin reductase subunit